VDNKSAHVISFLFHPLLLATYIFAAFIFLEPMVVVPAGYSSVARWLIVLVVWLTTFAIPVLSLALLKFMGTIKSFTLRNRQERLLPFFYIALFYALTAYYFSAQMMVTGLTAGIFVLTAIMIFAAAVVTLFWQISAHALGVGGLTGTLLAVNLMLPGPQVNYLLLVVVLVAGLVMSARLRLQAHTPAQVYAGFLLGLFISFMIIFWF